MTFSIPLDSSSNREIGLKLLGFGNFTILWGKKAKTYIDEELNPAGCNVHDPLKEHFQEPKTINEILD